MSRPERTRPDWQYADGPEVGREIPITSEPREEEAPGVPRRRRGGDDQPPDGHERGVADDDIAAERREVRAADPELSAETNERVTAELRDVVGAEAVRVPAGRPRASRGEHPRQHGFSAAMNLHRVMLLRTTAIVLTFGAIVSLATGNWWLLPVAAAVHALGTMTVVLSAFRLTTVSEHPSPQVAAALSEEGITNPDEHFSRMVEEFREEPERDTADVISPGHNERTVAAGEDPAAAGAEQARR